MPEIVLQTGTGKHETDERFAFVEIHMSAAQVQRVPRPSQGMSCARYSNARGEPSWCIAARIAMARQQIADSNCLPSELAPVVPQPKTQTGGAVRP